MKRAVIVGIASMAAALVFGSGATLAAVVFESEIDSNNSITSPQALVFTNGSATVHAVMGQLGPTPVDDTDFFSFEVAAVDPDLVTVEVVNANGGQQNFFPFISLFNPGPNHSIRTNGGDTEVPGDKRLQDTLPAGRYVIGVTFFPREFNGDGSLNFDFDFTGGVALQNGDYTLIVSGVTPPPGGGTGGGAGDSGSGSDVIPVVMEVRPGEKHFVRLNPKSRATLKVAILSSSTFDASEVDAETLTFGATGGEQSLKDCREKMKDVNRDGRKDLICRFYINKGGFEVGDQGVVLKGSTITGAQFKSHGSLKVKYERRKHHNKRDDDDHKGKHHGKHDRDGDDDDDDDDNRGKGHGKKERD